MAIKRAFREYLFIILTPLIGLAATFGLMLAQYESVMRQTKALLFNIDRQALLIFLFGVSFTFILTYSMLTRIRENKRITQQVEDRTRELSHMQKELELILNSTMEGIIGIDKNARIVFCNLMAPLLLGYKKSEIIGQSFHEMIQHIKPGIEEKNSVAMALQQGMENKAVTTEVFWRRNNLPMRVEYSISSLVEDNAITGAVIVFRDSTERKQYEENLEQMALFDQLTQVANRRQFIELLKKSISRAQRTKKQIGILYFDLNNFKEVNDTHGHATGDLVLIAFANRIQTALREYDTVARLGGDEFAIIVDAITDRGEAMIIVERILNVLEKPLVTKDGDFLITASIGIAVYPEDANNYDALITCADTAMYAAKKNKSKRYVFYEKGK